MSEKLTQIDPIAEVSERAVIYVVDPELTTADRRRSMTKSAVQKDYVAPMLPSSQPPVQNVYSNITELLSQQGSQTIGFLNRVIDASDDPGVTSGRAYYNKLATSTGALSDYDRLTDEQAQALDDAQGSETADIGTVIPLDTAFGHWCNMQSANSNTSYTLNNENVISAYAVVLINAASEPSITGANQQGGIPFKASTNLHLVVINQGDSGVRYYYTNPTVPSNDLIVEGQLTVNENGETIINTSGGSIEDDGGTMTIQHSSQIELMANRVTKNANDVTSYAGNWNASTNSPALANTDTNKHSIEYKVSVAGTHDFGAGPITFAVGDIVANDGSIWYKKVDNNQSGGGSVSLPWIDITDAPYNAVADALGDSGVDSTTAFNDAIDDLITAGGGVLYIPHTDGTRFNITPVSNDSKDYSNIVIMSFGTGNIFIKDTDTLGNPGRGVLINLADGTDNFRMKNLDILTSEGCANNGFETGVVCQEALGSWSNVTIENCKIYSEARPDTQIGNHAITFFRDVTNASDTATCSNLTIRDCDIYLTGHTVYAIHTLRDIDTVLIDNNVFELTAFNDNSNDAFNAVALYGDSRNFSIINNTVKSSGHSALAASMAENGVIAFNRVYNVSVTSEAGIEVEYKSSHGTNLTSPDFQTKSVKIHNNYIEGCYYGILVTSREVTQAEATDTSPYDVQITNNTILDSEEIGILVAQTISDSTPDYTNRIKDILIDGNYIENVPTDASVGIRIYDTDGAIVKNNTVKGGEKCMVIGRNATIGTIGNFIIDSNKFIADSDAVEPVFLIESAPYVNRFLFTNNFFDGDSQGVAGLQFNANIATGNLVMCRNNVFQNCTDGIISISEAADLAGSSFMNNYAIDCSARGFRLTINNGIATDNISINCPTADSFGGSGMTATGNKDL